MPQDKEPQDQVQPEIEIAAEDVRRRARLTPLKSRFITEIVKDPSRPTQAAVLAGYKPSSARLMAYKLMRDPIVQSALVSHFTDHEQELTSMLTDSLLRLQKIIRESNDTKFLKAFDKIIAYSKMAIGALGLTPELKKSSVEAQFTGPIDVRDLIAKHKEEIDRLEALLPVLTDRNEESEIGSGEAEVQ